METVNLTVAQGDNPVRTWQLTQAKQILNLTGSTVFAVFKPGPGTSDDAPTARTLTEGAGLTITDAATGTVAIDIPAALTADPGTWYYKIRVTSGSRTETAVDGSLRIQDT